MASKRTRLGFTLIELTVVAAVLILLAAAVTPNLVAFQTSQRERTFITKLENLGPEAREKAIATGKPVDLEYDDSANQLKLHSTDSSGNDQDLTTLSLPDSMKMNRLVLGSNDSNPSDWKLNFYPDGSADGGGIEMTLPDASLMSLYVEKPNGRALLLRDRLPDPSTESWQAGDYVHRTS